MAKAIMIQGTMSNAGKSLIAGALCRIFKQDGYRVAPFKSQNMALNSYITEDGLEMGRAQVMQAEAAGVKPDVRMNPILLKPTNDTGSQVIVNGEVRGTMHAADYFKYKKQLIPDIMRAYNSLSEENDIIVIEGAGSPAEINLKSEDIVNMGMAKLAKAPVILVGDIDRGGVFAQLVGTLELLENDERDIIKGLIINKFRGDKSILQSGIDMLYDRTHKDILGVMPYANIDIDDEDSLTERFDKKDSCGIIDIAVIRTPRIANFTDFNVLECTEGVSVRYVKSPQELKSPDLIILPGTKNTIGDMRWLRESGMEVMIKKHHDRGKPIIGICGGYQMLGEVIEDLNGTEGGGEIRGLELLPVKTVFENEKTRTRVEGVIKNATGIFKSLNDKAVTGYEIHMGESFITDGGSDLGTLYDTVSKKEKSHGLARGNVIGTYVHGFFDSEEISKSIIAALMREKGIYEMPKTFDMQSHKENSYEELARIARQNMDIQKIYEIIERGI